MYTSASSDQGEAGDDQRGLGLAKADLDGTGLEKGLVDVRQAVET